MADFFGVDESTSFNPCFTGSPTVTGFQNLYFQLSIHHVSILVLLEVLLLQKFCVTVILITAFVSILVLLEVLLLQSEESICIDT